MAAFWRQGPTIKLRDGGSHIGYRAEPKPEIIGKEEREMAEKKEPLSARMARIEEKHEELADMVKILYAAQIKTEERFQQTDERLEKLVSAIGELIIHLPPIQPKAS
jgi:predicted  nucleic acid-binding Zn-ribbon protein